MAELSTEQLANIAATYGITVNEATVPASDVPPEYDDFLSRFTALADFPVYIPEDENDEILIKGRWLERGGSAFVVSTAGTGKSIMSVQMALMWSEGLPFAGLRPRKPLNVCIFQSEDSPSRITIDRDDILAELAETHTEVDWRATAKKVRFVKLSGKVGAEWLDALDDLLSQAELHGVAPDVIIINPFLAFIGGPITDGQYVTPFLRGGEINRQHTDGLQCIMERHRVGALIFHHTPKPPAEKEISGWLKSPFPEYQGAGSSDITNWGRSFVTMMKVPGQPRMVQLTAGKNGGELGWDDSTGARRKFMHWSDGKGVTGGNRHAWRECTDDEIAALSKEGAKTRTQLDEDSDKLAAYLREHASCQSDFFSKELGKNKRYIGNEKCGIPDKRFRAAWAFVRSNLERFNLAAYSFSTSRGWVCSYVGEPSACYSATVSAAHERGVSDREIVNGWHGWQTGGKPPVESTGGNGWQDTPPYRGVSPMTPDSVAGHLSSALPPVNLTEEPMF